MRTREGVRYPVVAPHGGPLSSFKAWQGDPEDGQSGPAFLAGSLYSSLRLSHDEQPPGVCGGRAALAQRLLLVRQCPGLVDSHTSALPPSDPLGSSMGLLPVAQMRRGSERPRASVSTQDTGDAPGGIPWAQLSSPAADSCSSQDPASSPPHPCPLLTSLCEGFLQPVAPQNLALPKQVHLRKPRGRGGGELSSQGVALRRWGQESMSPLPALFWEDSKVGSSQNIRRSPTGLSLRCPQP